MPVDGCGSAFCDSYPEYERVYRHFCPQFCTHIYVVHIILGMSARTNSLTPRLRKLNAALGQRIVVARIARKITQAQMAERAGVSRTTLSKLEAGDASISLGTLIQVLAILGLESDMDLLVGDDKVGQQLANAALSRPSSASGARVKRKG